MLQEKSRAQNRTKPYSEQDIGTTHLHRQYRTDLRQVSEKDYNKFVTLNTVRTGHNCPGMM